MNRHLIVIHNDEDFYFSFENDSFKVGREIDDNTRYSSVFYGLNFTCNDQQISVNEEILDSGVETLISGNKVLVHKGVELKSYKVGKTCIIGCDVLGYDILLPINKSIIVEKTSIGYHISTEEDLFLNGKLQHGEISVHPGDYIYIAGEMLFFTKNGIKIRKDVICSLQEDCGDVSKINPSNYHRSPRLYYMVNDDPVKIDNPATPPSEPEKSLLRLVVPPLIMTTATVVISILIGRGLFILISVMATLMATVNSIQSFLASRDKYRVESEERVVKYHDYLTQKSGEINLRIQEEIKVCNYHIIEPLGIVDVVKNSSRRIFERTNKDSDFLNVRIGKQTRPPQFKIELSERKINEKDDFLYEDAKLIKDNFRDIENVGLDVNIKTGNIGIVGTKELSLLIVKQMLLELITFHSYHDVQLLTIFNKDQLDELNWLSYAPHSIIDSINVRGLIYTDILRDQVLGSFTQIIKDREQKVRENEKVIFSPHYVVTILSSDLILEHSIAEYLERDLRDLAISIIVVENEHENLRENIDSVIEIYSKHRSRLLINQGEYVKKDFIIDEQPTNKQLLEHARTLRGFNHTMRSDSGLPQTITFMDMYEVETVDQLNISNRWKMNDSTKTLAVRLGANGESFVELNLHEKAHGPHGLVAGTTGSGKSEIIQSYILSLAVNFSPHEVAFLLIDYKGGGMANLFKELPHLIGTITNLDGDGSMRALVSIKSELLRRQELFSKYNVNHINQYIHLFKEGKTSDPLPHLFLISDEFAELKSEQPEFMEELVSTARIGRSLGIHLILATQKPSGVVDGQIWSNSKFKLCLKVQDEADSKEMLKTADAASITLPGRAYLQVGNNEIYELFQSAWSGGEYSGKKSSKTIDKRIYKINQLGQYQLINQDLSGVETEADVIAKNTELEEVIGEVKNTTGKMGLKPVAPIWLEDLQEKYYIDDYISLDFNSSVENVVLGYVDVPSQQKQFVYEKPLNDMGNFAFIGSSGYGKSYALMTSLFSLFSRNKASDLYAYILDFGNNSLINMRDLPHVAEYIGMDDSDKVEKFIGIISNEMNIRKKQFSDAGANHITVYNELAEEPLPKIIIALDNFDGIREEFDNLENFLIKITRDCNSLGIYFIATASRINAFRSVMINSIKTRIALFNIDNYEYNSIIGKSSFLPKDRAGSALVKYDGQAVVMQIFMPAVADSDVTMVKAIVKKVQDICENYNGETKGGIAVVKGDIDAKSFLQESSLCKDEIVIGVDYETVEPYGIKQSEISILPIMSRSGYGKTNFASFILMQNIPNLVIFDSEEKLLSSYKEAYPYYEISDKQAIAHALENSLFDGKIIVTDSGDEMMEKLGVFNLDAIVELVKSQKTKLIIPYNHNNIKNYMDDLSREVRRSNVQIMQVEPQVQSHVILSRTEIDKLDYKIGDVIYIDDISKRKIRVPKV